MLVPRAAMETRMTPLDTPARRRERPFGSSTEGIGQLHDLHFDQLAGELALHFHDPAVQQLVADALHELAVVARAGGEEVVEELIAVEARPR